MKKKQALKETFIIGCIIGAALAGIELTKNWSTNTTVHPTTLCKLEEMEGKQVKWSGTILEILPNNGTGTSITAIVSSSECAGITYPVFVPFLYQRFIEVGASPIFTSNISGGMPDVIKVEASPFNEDGSLKLDYLTVRMDRIPQTSKIGYIGRHPDGYEKGLELETPRRIREQFQLGKTYRIYYQDNVVQKIQEVTP